jgi:site-specific recombinase
MTNAKTSFWTPVRIAAVIGAVLLIVALAYLVSLPQNQFQPADLLEPRRAVEGTFNVIGSFDARKAHL